MGEVTQYARQAYLGTGPKGLLRATKGSKLPHPYRGITLMVIITLLMNLVSPYSQTSWFLHFLGLFSWPTLMTLGISR